MRPPLIDVRELWKIYHVGDVEVPAVCGVTLSIPHGQFVAVTGASGSGKSTFMHLIGCLDRPTSGSIAFDGRPVEGMSRFKLAALRNHRIGFVFQAFNLLARTTLVENVALPLMYQGIGRRERRRRAHEMLERVGLADRLRHYPNQLSGGQQQRVAIARAMVTRPLVILADEPTGNLDTKTSSEIMTLFQTLSRQEQISIVLVTHEAEIAGYAERHIAFRDGRIMSDDRREASDAA